MKNRFGLVGLVIVVTLVIAIRGGVLYITSHGSSLSEGDKTLKLSCDGREQQKVSSDSSLFLEQQLVSAVVGGIVAQANSYRSGIYIQSKNRTYIGFQEEYKKEINELIFSMEKQFETFSKKDEILLYSINEGKDNLVVRVQLENGRSIGCANYPDIRPTKYLE